jgi:putative transposase
MATRQFQLSKDEISAFRQAEARTRDVRELKRLQAVRLYGTGEAVPTIQKLVGCGPLSPRQWAIRYKRGGLDGLRVCWATGNANKLSEAQRAELAEKLNQYTPDQVLAADVRVERGSFWTVSDLQLVVERWYGVTYRSPRSYRTLLHQCGMSWQKTEKVYRSQPNAVRVAEFEAELEKK